MLARAVLQSTRECQRLGDHGLNQRFLFKSKSLLDVTALLSTMAYDDLNPVRAGIASNLNNSNFTSIQDRIREVSKQGIKGKPSLMIFSESKMQDEHITTIPFHLKDYIDLVDWTGLVGKHILIQHISNKGVLLLPAG